MFYYFEKELRANRILFSRLAVSSSDLTIFHSRRVRHICFHRFCWRPYSFNKNVSLVQWLRWSQRNDHFAHTRVQCISANNKIAFAAICALSECPVFCYSSLAVKCRRYLFTCLLLLKLNAMERTLIAIVVYKMSLSAWSECNNNKNIFQKNIIRQQMIREVLSDYDYCDNALYWWWPLSKIAKQNENNKHGQT